MYNTTLVVQGEGGLSQKRADAYTWANGLKLEIVAPKLKNTEIFYLEIFIFLPSVLTH